MKNAQTTLKADPLAHASERPDVTALIDEFGLAMQNGPAQLADLSQAEDVRYNRWPGKSPNRDGKLHQRFQPQGEIVRPYDKRPDTDVNIADEIIATEVDMDLMSLFMAQLGADTGNISQLTAAEIAELTAVARYVKRATQPDRRDGEELASQIKGSIGWVVINTGWRERWGLVEQTVTLDQVRAIAQQIYVEWAQAQAQAARQTRPTGPTMALVPAPAPEDPPAFVYLPQLILDPEPDMEEAAIELIQSAKPHLQKDKVRKIVRDLRTDGRATFLDRQLEEKRPTVKVLIPGVDFFVSGGASGLQNARGCLKVEFFYQAQIEEMAMNAGWNEEFIAAVIGTMGNVSSYASGLKHNSPEGVITDEQDRRIEIWTSEVRQFDPETGVTGIYCTTFSPHLRPSSGDEDNKKYFATHYVLSYAHGQYPYVVCRREVIGPALADSRGVPEMLRGDSNILKSHQDALGIRAQWEVSPAQVRIGSGWSKVKEPLAPGSVTEGLTTGADVKSFAPDRGNPQVGLAFMDRIESGTRRRFALPNNDPKGGHPSLWQMRSMRASRRTLGAWEDVYWQLVVIAYQELNPMELAQIIGRMPHLQVADLLNHRITLAFDARSLDGEWRKQTLETFVELLQLDKGGLIDTAVLIRIIGSMTDTTLMDQVLRDPQGASAALYRKVEGDVTTIMLGNPPPLVEMDASAGMQLQMAFSVLQKNPNYQQILRQNESVRENLKTYVQNLQHSEQETSISPVQGRLGVEAMPQRPVSEGNSLAQLA